MNAQSSPSTTGDRSPFADPFVVSTGQTSDSPPEPDRASVELRCEVMGINHFQKEGLIRDEATGRTWRLSADEGAALGGEGLAPSPLMHWAVGLHGDVIARIAALAATDGLRLRGLHASVEQGFAAQGSFVRGEAIGLVFSQDWTFTIDADAPQEQLAALADRAIASSPAIAALTNAAEGAFALTANGRAVPVSGLLASTAAPEPDPFRAHASMPEPAEPPHERLIVPLPGAESKARLTDDQQGAVHFSVVASGDYDLDTGIVTTTVGFPRSGGDQWQQLSDVTNLTAPSPLSYFAIGTAFCYHTQLARYAHVRRLQIKQPRMVQTCTLSADEARPFDTQLFLRGTADPGQCSDLLSAAARTCYAHRALATTVEITQAVNRSS